MSGLRDVGWKQRLWIEECLVGFDPTLLQRAGEDLLCSIFGSSYNWEGAIWRLLIFWSIVVHTL